MASVYDLKPKFQEILRPGLRRLVHCGVTPNLLTLSALAGSVCIGVLISFVAKGHPAWLIILPAWLFVRMALNALDGMAAREFNMKTRLGAVLNEIGDILSDLALYWPLGYMVGGAVAPVAAFCIGATLTEFCGVLIQALGGSRQYEGPMGKSDRAFWVGALALAGARAPATLIAWPAAFWVLAALTLLTCSNRLRSGLRSLSDHPQ